MAKEFIKMGAAWKHTSAKGNKFISGQFEVGEQKYAFIMFANIHKEEGSKKPDFLIYKGDSDIGGNAGEDF